MNNLWLREYEKVLSSGRKDKDLTKVPGKLNLNPRKKKTRVKAKSVKKGAECSEAAVAQRLLALSIREDYNKYGPENEAKLMITTQQMERKAKREKVFDPIPTLEQFEEDEKRREDIIAAGGSSYFQTLYPVIGHSLPREIYQSPTAAPPSRSPFGTSFLGTSTSGIFRNTRPCSSPLRRSDTFRQSISPGPSPVRAVDDSSHTLQDHVMLHVPSVYVKESVAQKAESMWGVLLDDLRHAGCQIEYSDVSTLSVTWLQGECTQFMVQYICALLGLRTSLSELRSVAERSLFNQKLSLIKFFREVRGCLHVVMTTLVLTFVSLSICGCVYIYIHYIVTNAPSPADQSPYRSCQTCEESTCHISTAYRREHGVFVIAIPCESVSMDYIHSTNIRLCITCTCS